MVVKIYVSGISGNKEVKKKQQRVQMILESKSIVYEAIDITEPGREKDKETMQSKSKVREVLGKHPLPPQLFNDEEYCGDYEDFDLANEIDGLEAFLHLPIPSKLISCDNDTITAKVNGSREGVDEVTNGGSAEKVNGDVELTSVNCDGDVSGSATDAVSPPVEGEETTVDDATPEENIVNSTPEETPEKPQTSQNEIEEDEKDNEIDTDATGEKTEEDRLDEEDKVEDENDEPIAQHEIDVSTEENKIEDIVTEQITQQEKDVPIAEVKSEDTVSEQISQQENDDPKDEREIEDIVSEQIAEQENDVPNAEIKIEDFVSENKEFDDAEDFGVDKIGLMPASESLISENSKNDNNKSLFSKDMLSKVEDTESYTKIVDTPTNEHKKNSSIKTEIAKEMIEKSSDVKTQSNWEMPKSPIKTVDLSLNIPVDCSKDRPISELEKTEPLEWVDDIGTINKNKQNVSLTKMPAFIQIPIQKDQEVRNEDSVLRQLTAHDPESMAVLKKDSTAQPSCCEKEGAEVQVDMGNIATQTLIARSTENEEATKQLLDFTFTKCKSTEIDKEIEKKDVSVAEMRGRTVIVDKTMPLQVENESDAIETLGKTKAEPEEVLDAASSSVKASKELNVDSQEVTEENREAVIITSEQSDDNLLMMPPSEVNKAISSENSENKTTCKTGIQSEDNEEDPNWQGKRLCRRDTLKKIKRPSLPLLRPSTIKEESVDINRKQTDLSSKNISENPNNDMSIVIDINSNECPMDSTATGKPIDQSLKSPNSDAGMKNVSPGSSNSSSTSGNSQNTQQSSSGSVNSSGSQNVGSTGTSISSSRQNSPRDSQNSNLSNSSAGGSINMNSPNSDAGIKNVSPESSNSSSTSGNSQNTQQSSLGSVNSSGSQNVGRNGTSTSSSPQNSPRDSQNSNLSNSSAGGSINMNSSGTIVSQGTSGSLNIQLEDASGQITNLDEVKLPDNTGASASDSSPEHATGVPMKELLKENYISPFSVDKIAYSPQLVSKIKSDSLKRDEKGVILPNWDQRPTEVDLVRQVRYLLDERDTEIAISRARMRAGRSPLRDPHHHFLLEMKRMINKYKEQEEEVDWPVVPPPRPPTPPPPEPPVNEFLEEVLRALNAPYIPKPPPEEPKKNVFLSQVQVLLDSEQMTGDSQATFFQKERGPVEDPEFVHKVRKMLNERESTLGLIPMEHPEKRDHTEFLSEVLVLLEEEPIRVTEVKPIEVPEIKVEPEAEKEEAVVKEQTPPPIVEEKLKSQIKQVKEKPNKKTEEDLPKKKEIEIAQIFIRDNIFPVTAQVSSDNFKIFVSALDSQRIELKNEDLDALTITVIEDNGYKSDVAKIVVSPNL